MCPSSEPVLNILSDICAISGLYAAWNGSSLQTFRDNLPAPSSRVKQSKMEMGPIGCPETLVISYYSILRKILEQRRCHLHRRKPEITQLVLVPWCL